MSTIIDKRGCKMKEQVTDYLLNLLPAKDSWVVDLEEQAHRDRIPIMDELSMDFMTQLIRMNKPKTILEIGTAIGYSALRMYEAYPETTITTIEKDEHRYNQAISNLRKYNRQNQIKVISGDALNVMEEMISANESFDCVFIDAAKGQYLKYFNLADSLLVNNGFIIADNVLFRGYVADDNFDHPRYRTMVKRLREFNEQIVSQPGYHTSIIPVGDGIAISYKSSREESSCQ